MKDALEYITKRQAERHWVIRHLAIIIPFSIVGIVGLALILFEFARGG